MYSLTFCVRFVARTPPAAGRRRAGRARFPYAALGFGGAPRRPPARADPAQPAVRAMSSYRGMDASL